MQTFSVFPESLSSAFFEPCLQVVGMSSVGEADPKDSGALLTALGVHCALEVVVCWLHRMEDTSRFSDAIRMYVSSFDVARLRSWPGKAALPSTYTRQHTVTDSCVYVRSRLVLSQQFL